MRFELDGTEVIEKKWSFPKSVGGEDFVLRAQMAVVGVNILVESSGHSTLIGFADFSDHIDIRDTKHMRQYDFGISAELEPNSRVTIDRAAGALTPGTGQADIRAITDPEGRPLFDEGRLWFTMTVRGRALPNPMQAVFSLNPSVFDIKFEGIIAFDLGDGKLRNEHASHIFRDTESGDGGGGQPASAPMEAMAEKKQKRFLPFHRSGTPVVGFRS